MFLGLALPLALLSIINSRNSRIVLDNIYRANIPVILTSSGNFVNVARVVKLSGSNLLGQEDFSPFSSGKEVVRSKQIGAELLKGITPRNPFGMLQAILSTSPGLVIASSTPHQGRKGMPNNQTQGAINPSGLVYVTLTETANEQLKAENQGNRESTDRIEGSLTALLRLNTGDPVAQVDYLNTRIIHEGGWLNNLLSVVPSPVKDETSEPEKKSRNKKGAVAPVALLAAEADEWGTTSTSRTETPDGLGNSSSGTSASTPKTSSDDWDGPSTSSDLDSPGSTRSSNEEW